VTSQGETIKEAQNNLKEAIGLYKDKYLGESMKKVENEKIISFRKAKRILHKPA